MANGGGEYFLEGVEDIKLRKVDDSAGGVNRRGAEVRGSSNMPSNKPRCSETGCINGRVGEEVAGGRVAVEGGSDDSGGGVNGK